MKSALQALSKGLQRALQLDLFSDFLVPDTLQSEPKKPLAKRTPVATPDVQPVGPKPYVNTTNKRRILLREQLVEYDLQRSKRRSIGFMINEHGLRVTAPRWVTIPNVEVSIREKQNWILTKLHERRERALLAPKLVTKWEDGSQFPYLGNMLTVRIALLATRRSVTPVLDAETAELRVYLRSEFSEQQLRERIKFWLQQEAKRIFTERLHCYAEQLAVSYQSLQLSSATTRWGSCTSQGKIRLNWRLIHFSQNLIDYVVAHELAHRHEMNHSPRFWAQVESVYPDYANARKILRSNNASCLPEL